ncbi:hypothetical protein [Kitasatospora griseola]|uniref:hypothetical protein n=1 Tax=Kitasatospora griseola TaxID=2064 RepID=UPI0037F9C467
MSPLRKKDPTRTAPRRRRIAVVAATALAAVGLSATPALAATHRGVAGCFAWSWDDSGWFSTTVYWHNRCSVAHRIEVVWDGNAYALTTRSVPANGSGNTWTTSDAVEHVYDLGRA